MNFCPWNFGDYSKDTVHLSWDEDAAYRRMLDWYYVNESPLTVDLRQLYRQVRATTDAQREAVQTVLAEFFELTDRGWVHHRCELEIQTARDKSGKASKSAKDRWNKQKQSEGKPDAMRTHAQDDANASEKGKDAMLPIPRTIPIPINTGADALVLSGDPETTAEKKVVPIRIAIPYEEILAAFHRALPGLPRVLALNDDRKRKLAMRWREVDAADKFKTALEGVQTFEAIFERVGQSDFLMGRKTSWRASFDWLIANGTNILKIVEGRYDNEQGRK